MFDPAFELSESECRRLLRSSVEKSRRRSLYLLRRLARHARGSEREDIGAALEVLRSESEADSFERHTSPLFRGWLTCLARGLRIRADVKVPLSWVNNMCLSLSPTFQGGSLRSLASCFGMVPTWKSERCFRLQADQRIPRDLQELLACETTGCVLPEGRVPLDLNNPLLRVELDACPLAVGSGSRGEELPWRRDPLLERALGDALCLLAGSPADRSQLEILVRILAAGEPVGVRTTSGGAGVSETHPGAAWVGPLRPLDMLELLLQISSHTRMRYLRECSPLLCFVREADEQHELGYVCSPTVEQRVMVERLVGVYGDLMTARALVKCAQSLDNLSDERRVMQHRATHLVRAAREVGDWLELHAPLTDMGRRFQRWSRHTISELCAALSDLDFEPAEAQQSHLLFSPQSKRDRFSERWVPHGFGERLGA